MFSSIECRKVNCRSNQFRTKPSWPTYVSWWIWNRSLLSLRNVWVKALLDDVNILLCTGTQIIRLRNTLNMMKIIFTPFSIKFGTYSKKLRTRFPLKIYFFWYTEIIFITGKCRPNLFMCSCKKEGQMSHLLGICFNLLVCFGALSPSLFLSLSLSLSLSEVGTFFLIKLHSMFYSSTTYFINVINKRVFVLQEYKTQDVLLYFDEANQWESVYKKPLVSTCIEVS